MKKHIIAIIMSFCFILLSISLPVSASTDNSPPVKYSQDAFIDSDITYTPRSTVSSFNEKISSKETILTRHSDGTVTQTVYDFSAHSAVDSTTELNVSAYLPSSELATENSTLAVSADSHGRTPTTPTENRCGELICGFDTDGDNKSDMFFGGSASLQHKDLLISCAHCIWDPVYANTKSKGWATDITFYAGRTSTETYAKEVNCSSWSISQNYVNSSSVTFDENNKPIATCDFNWDWSILHVPEDIGSLYGWFGLHGCSPVEKGLSIYTIGYPGDKPDGSQWTSPGKITDFPETNLMLYTAYIFAGNSGGPILNDSRVFGIATFHTESKPGSWAISGGTRIYDGLFNIIVDERNKSADRWK